MVWRIAKGNAARYNRVLEVEVEDEVCVGSLLRFIEIDGSYAQNGIVFKDSPKESPGRAMVFSVVYGRSRS